ncbi:hypothetical protein [Thioclava sp.]|uniref:hypothetical protein n=1 Tax=Thioclava sp. TaxID=1933450 RepID=UPI003AA9793E
MVHPNSAIKTVIFRAPLKGKRMRPATLVTQKELSQVYDRRVIRFVIHEAMDAGAKRIIDRVSAAKPAVRVFIGDKGEDSERQLTGAIAVATHTKCLIALRSCATRQDCRNYDGFLAGPNARQATEKADASGRRCQLSVP